MYFLMNKDNKIASFQEKPRGEFSTDVSYTMIETEGNLPIGFTDINTWIDGRKASKHNAHLKSIMRQMGCDDNEGFIKTTHAATINDCFWIKSDKENITWEEVSLYRNQFTEAISRLAFEGVGLYDAVFSSTSPELACDGSFRKCFRKEKEIGEYGSDIFLYKRGHELGDGLEPYCEQMASEIARIISPKHAISYDLVTLHGKLASKCNLFTNEEYGYASFAKVADSNRLDMQEVFEYFAKIGSEQIFREMLVVDSLCFNQDRHTGNYGVLFQNDTLQVTEMAPIFDLNLSLLPYVTQGEFATIGDKLFEYAPKLGEDFTQIGQMGVNDIIRDRVKNIRDFSFSFRGDDIFTSDRVKQIEGIVRQQAEAILSKERLYTKDVFFSQKAVDIQKQGEEVLKAGKILDGFEEIINNKNFSSDVFVSICKSSDTVQIYIEKESYMITVDFLKRDVFLVENMQTITDYELSQKDEAFAMVFREIRDCFQTYIKETDVQEQQEEELDFEDL